jgi:rod shape-determining protein MreD
MKPRVYFLFFLLAVPVQASLLNPLSLGGIKPDLVLSLLYGIGLLTGPVEAALAGMCVGLVQDVGTAGLLGLNAFTRGLIGLGAGLLGNRIFDRESPANFLFLSAFSLMEGVVIAVITQVFYGNMPILRQFFTFMIPQALSTGLLGALLLRFLMRKNIITLFIRRPLQKE